MTLKGLLRNSPLEVVSDNLRKVNILLDKHISNKFLREAADWALAIFFAVIVFLVLQNFVFRTAKVDGISMEPTFQNNDYVIINRFIYIIGEPQRNDIIAFPYPQDNRENFIKRIVGLPGDDIDFIDYRFYINGTRLTDPFSSTYTYLDDVLFPETVPEGQYFVLGDNRNASQDSRSSEVGFIRREDILGRVRTRFWPLDNVGIVR
jgi:signal peptidase I